MPTFATTQYVYLNENAKIKTLTSNFAGGLHKQYKSESSFRSLDAENLAWMRDFPPTFHRYKYYF